MPVVALALGLVGLPVFPVAAEVGDTTIAPVWGLAGVEIVVSSACPIDGGEVLVELQHVHQDDLNGVRAPLEVPDVVVEQETVTGRVALPSVYDYYTGILLPYEIVFQLGYQLVGAVSCDGGGSWARSSQRFTVATAPFVGVSAGHRFHDEIAWVGAEGISTGYAEGEFGPDRPVSRQAMVAYLYRLAGSQPVPQEAPVVYSDIGTDHPFYAPTFWACQCFPMMTQERVAYGYSDGTFRPGEHATREAAAAFFYRLAGEPEVVLPQEPTFVDVPVGHPFYDAIEWVAVEGIVEGYPDGAFAPGAPITRQAAAAMLHRFDHVVGPVVAG